MGELGCSTGKQQTLQLHCLNCWCSSVQQHDNFVSLFRWLALCQYWKQYRLSPLLEHVVRKRDQNCNEINNKIIIINKLVNEIVTKKERPDLKRKTAALNKSIKKLRDKYEILRKFLLKQKKTNFLFNQNLATTSEQKIKRIYFSKIFFNYRYNIYLRTAALLSQNVSLKKKTRKLSNFLKPKSCGLLTKALFFKGICSFEINIKKEKIH